MRRQKTAVQVLQAQYVKTSYRHHNLVRRVIKIFSKFFHYPLAIITIFSNVKSLAQKAFSPHLLHLDAIFTFCPLRTHLQHVSAPSHEGRNLAQRRREMPAIINLSALCLAIMVLK
jgi:hypothetical protein